MMLINQELNKIFQSEKDKLRNADQPQMMRPKNNRKPLKGIARTLYLNGKVTLNRAEEFATTAMGLSLVKKPVEKKEKKDET